MLDKYNYTEKESGRTETLIQALEKIERLEKQLRIAVKWINEIADGVNIYFEKDGRSKEFTQDCLMSCGLSANQALHDIKELEK